MLTGTPITYLGLYAAPWGQYGDYSGKTETITTHRPLTHPGIATLIRERIGARDLARAHDGVATLTRERRGVMP